MIQLLPVNDTSVYNMWWDSYPYSSVSVRLCQPTASPVLPSGQPCIITASFQTGAKSHCCALQVFALHPLYLSLPALAPSRMPADIAKSIGEAREELDGLAVDYERTMALKLAIARRIFHSVGQAELKVR